MATVTKSGVSKQDINFFNGVDTTTTRVDSTGGNSTVIPFGYEVDVLSVYGNGTAFTDATISTAITKIGSTNPRVLVLDIGTWTLSANLSIPANIMIYFPNGAIIDASAAILTLNNPDQIIAGKRQKIFTINAATDIVFTNPGDIYSGWFGASVSETAANNTTYLKYCFGVAKTCGGNQWTAGGKYAINATQFDANGVSMSFGFKGIGRNVGMVAGVDAGTIFDASGITAAGSDKAMSFINSNASTDAWNFNCDFRDFCILGPADEGVASPVGTTTGLFIDETIRSTWTNITVLRFRTGIQADGAFGGDWRNVYSNECYYGLFLNNSSHPSGTIANSNSRFQTCNFNNCYVGVAIRDSNGGITFDDCGMESTTVTGFYITPTAAGTIKNININNCYFEGTTTAIEIGTNTYATKSGTVEKITINGGHYDNNTTTIHLRSCSDIYLNVPPAVLTTLNVDGTAGWHTRTTGDSVSASKGTANWNFALTDFYTRIDQSIGGNITGTLPAIANIPRNTPYTIYRIDDNNGTIQIDANSTELISGVQALDFNGKNLSITIIRDTTSTEQWRIINGCFGSKATWDPGSIADGDEVAVDVTVNGAELGDLARASFSNDVTDLVLDAQVTAANTVTCVLANNTGGAIDLASGTVKVRVWK